MRNNRAAVTAYLNKDLKERFDRLATIELRSTSSLVAWLIQSYVQRAEQEGKFQ
jgi:predicted transcriptional regulator